MRRIAWFGITVAVLSFGGCAYFTLSGSAVVHDDTGDVESAMLTSDVLERRLHRLPGGTFYGIPDFDGTIEVRCKDGSKAQAGYVTSGFHTTVRVVGSTPCRLVEEH
jgi:hypothetical protein